MRSIVLFLVAFFAVLALVLASTSSSSSSESQSGISSTTTESPEYSTSNSTNDTDASFDLKAVANAILPITYLLDHLSPQAVKSTIVGAVHGEASWVTCTLCSVSVSTIRLFPEVSTVRAIFTQICSRFNYEDYRVCTGIADLYGDEFIYILKNSKLYANEICGLVISPTCMSSSSNFPKSEQWNLFQAYNLTDTVKLKLSRRKHLAIRKSLAAREVPQKRMDPAKNVSTILHLSDLHLDQKYQVNTYAYCSEPLCCRSQSIPTGKSIRAGYWGSFGNCDSNIHNIESLFTTVTNDPFKNQYKYVIFTGDYIAHDVWLTTKEEIISTTRRLNGEFKQRMPKNKIVIPVIGNHEGHPVDQFCPPEIPAPEFHMNWLYEELLDQWKPWIPESQHELFKQYGYYSLVDGRVKWIVLNMNYCNRLNFWIAYDYKELGGMLLWFQKELQDALAANQHVYITGHIAPDPADCVDNWINAYEKIIDIYQPIIKGQFFGHTHFDEIRLYYNQKNTPTGVAYLAPSVTTFGDVHPSFRLYNTDPESGDIVDHRTYILNITSANQDYLLNSPYRASVPTWEFLYSARDSYNLTSLSTLDWHNFFVSAPKNPDMVQKYYQHYGRYDQKVMDAAAYDSMLNVMIDRIHVKPSSK